MTKRRPAKRRNQMHTIPSVQAPMTFEFGKDFVTAVINISESQTIGLKFESPEQILEMSLYLIENASIVWPEHPLIKHYQED